MPDQPSLIRHNDLLNRLVLDRKTTEELGRVERVWMHPPVHRVLGFICKSGLLGSQRFAFNLQQLKRMGRTSLVVDSTPVETNAVEVGHLETLIGNELWSDGGDRIGKIIDCLFNLQTGVITDYLFRSEGWQRLTGGVYRLPTHQILNFGKKRVLVAEAATHQFIVFQDGMEQRVSKASDRLGDRYGEVTRELKESLEHLPSSLTAQTQEVTQQAQGQLQWWTNMASQHMESLTHQATQKAQSLSQYLGEEAQDLAQETHKQGRSLMERFQERIEQLGEEINSQGQSNSQDQSGSGSIPEPYCSPPVGEVSDECSQDWSFGLSDVASEDLEEDDPWI